jgi:hypothetical protein
VTNRASLAALAALVGFATAAHAEPDAKPKVTLEGEGLFSIPFLFGVDAALASPSTSTGFVFGLRPEYIRAWTSSKDPSFGFGVGPYAEFLGSFGTSQIWLGGGATIVGYFGHLGVAASGGLDVDWFHADAHASPSVGLFVGLRTSDTKLDGFDLPFGVRVDVHPSVDAPAPTTVIVSAQLDIATLLVGGFLYAVMRGLSH